MSVTRADRRPQRRVLTALAALLALVALASACTPPVTPSPTPIGPNQRFSGLVNGSRGTAVITTACGGPAVAGRTGHPLAGQTLAVTADPAGHGDTGSHSSSVFAQTGSSYAVVQLRTYDEAVALPTDLEVPCEGSGTVTFLQCFGIIACLDGAPDVVKVTFVNIAV